MLEVRSDFFFGQFFDMPDRSEHRVVFTKILVNRFRFRGRLDNHQTLSFGIRRWKVSKLFGGNGLWLFRRRG
jgi:hypothetical protein